MTLLTSYSYSTFIHVPPCVHTMVVSAIEPKLLMKMLQETLTGGPGKGELEILKCNAIKLHNGLLHFLFFSNGLSKHSTVGYMVATHTLSISTLKKKPFHSFIYFPNLFILSRVAGKKNFLSPKKKIPATCCDSVQK